MTTGQRDHGCCTSGSQNGKGQTTPPMGVGRGVGSVTERVSWDQRCHSLQGRAPQTGARLALSGIPYPEMLSTSAPLSNSQIPETEGRMVPGGAKGDLLING